MTRQRFLWSVVTLACLGILAGGVLAWQVQRPTIKRLGFLGQTVPQPFYEALPQELGALGYDVGRDLTIEYRYAEGRLERLPELADELVRLDVDVIVTAGNVSVQVAKATTSTIPIVMGLSTDPVGIGVVDSLARPGGNVTGPSMISSLLTSKRLGLLQEAVPAVSRIAVLMNRASPGHPSQWSEAQRSAQVGGLHLQLVEMRGDGDLTSAIEAATAGGAEALLVLDDPVFTARRGELVELATRARLPAMYTNGEQVRAGGLMAYGPNFADQLRRSAIYVDKILKGAKPADLPVEQPSKFDFLINLKAAQALGVAIPDAVLGQATEVIQ